LPDLEANMLPEGEYATYNLYLQTNFMQNWEGEMDTVHAAFLHGSFTPRKNLTPGSAAYFVEQNKAPRFSVLDTEFGTSYGAYRPAGEDGYYWRIAHMLFPFYAMIPTGTLGLNVFWRAYVPMDDEHTLMWTQVGGREGDRRITPLTGTGASTSRRGRRTTFCRTVSCRRRVRATPGSRAARGRRTWPSPGAWARSTTVPASTWGRRTS
jgi:hypothetical protein